MEEDNEERNKKILTYVLVTFMLLVVGAAAIYLFLIQGNSGNTKTNDDVSVADEITTEEVIVTNIGSSTASISWYTPQTSNGYVVYGLSSDSLDQTRLNTNTSEKNTHHIDLTNLEEETTYFFQIQGENETVVNSATYNFETLSQSDDISVPSSLLITLPSVFSEGIIYAHASDGSVVSPAVSTYTFSNSASLDIGPLQNNLDGDAFSATEAGITVSATGADGSRYSSKFTLDASKIELTTTDTTAVAYNPNTIFVPVTATASEDPTVPTTPDSTPVTPTDNQTPTIETPTTPTTSSDTPTTNDSPTTVPTATTLPSTAIGDDPARDVALFIGVISFIFGFKLLIGSGGQEDEDYY